MIRGNLLYTPLAHTLSYLCNTWTTFESDVAFSPEYGKLPLFRYGKLGYRCHLKLKLRLKLGMKWNISYWYFDKKIKQMTWLQSIDHYQIDFKSDMVVFQIALPLCTTTIYFISAALLCSLILVQAQYQQSTEVSK